MAGALGLGGVLVKAMDWWKVRRDETRREPAAQTAADAELVKAIGEFSQQFGEAAGGLLEHFRIELKDVREKVEACEARHAECDAKVHDLSRRLDVSENDRLAALARIDRLMEEHPPAPPYAPPLLSGVIPPTTSK